jgi:hypothetical protein
MIGSVFVLSSMAVETSDKQCVVGIQCFVQLWTIYQKTVTMAVETSDKQCVVGIQCFVQLWTIYQKTVT